MKASNNKVTRVFLITFLSGLIFLVGCASTMSVRLLPPEPLSPSGEFMAGAAKIDITPMPGFPMGGYSLAAKTSRGWWTRLYARTIYFEDQKGTALVLVSCDLWIMPAGLANRVAEIIQDTLSHIGRESIVLAATHTHHSPGNYCSSEFYNNFGSNKKGFDESLFEFFAQRIAQSIIQAHRAKRAAIVRWGETRVAGLARNRSYPAFILNPERDEILSENGDIPVGAVSTEYPDSDAFRAINPTLSVLRVEDTEVQNLIAVAAFFAVHPNSMGSTPEVYNSGLFGVASTLVEQHLSHKDTGDDQVIVALFNGAEGDISPVWDKQDRRTTLKLGGILADSIIHAISKPQDTVHGTINIQFENVRLADAYFDDTLGIRRYTDYEGIPGDPLLGGAEDGRSFAYDLGFVEGLKGERTERQGSKKLVFDTPLYPPFIRAIVDHIRSSLVKSVPQYALVGLYRVGKIVLCTLPGEFTTTLGRRISRSVEKLLELNHPPLMVGLANEYVSYFTTPEEYESQQYEGASTLYGPASGPLVASVLSRLAGTALGPAGHILGTYNYSPGDHETFSIDNGGAEPWFPDFGLENVAQDLATGLPKRDYPQFAWEDIIPYWTLNYTSSTTPSVEVQVMDNSSGKWKTLEVKSGINNETYLETDKGLDFVTVASLKKGMSRSKWFSIWMYPQGTDKSLQYRFSVKKLGGAQICSKAFRIDSIESGLQRPIISIEDLVSCGD